jgi:hypothetical protein
LDVSFKGEHFGYILYVLSSSSGHSLPSFAFDCFKWILAVGYDSYRLLATPDPWMSCTYGLSFRSFMPFGRSESPLFVITSFWAFVTVCPLDCAKVADRSRDGLEE